MTTAEREETLEHIYGNYYIFLYYRLLFFTNDSEYVKFKERVRLLDV